MKAMREEGKIWEGKKIKSVFRPGLPFCRAHAGSGIEGGSGFFSSSPLPLFFDRKRPSFLGRRLRLKGRHRPVCNSSNHWKEGRKEGRKRAVFVAVRFGVEENCGSVVLWFLLGGRPPRTIFQISIFRHCSPRACY